MSVAGSHLGIAGHEGLVASPSLSVWARLAEFDNEQLHNNR